jgi:microcystin-dependent protein
MSAFDHSILTNVGWDQLSAAIAGGNLTFLRMEAGDGTVTGDEEMEGLTSLKNYVMDIPITSYSDDGEGQLTLIGTLSSKNVETAFYFRELGVVATVSGSLLEKIGISSEGTHQAPVGEQLYAVANSYDLADYIPDKNNAAVVIQNIEIIIKIDRATQITVNLSLGANVTAQNIGPATEGAGWFRDKLGNILYFKRFASSGSFRIFETADLITGEVIFPPSFPTGSLLDYPGLIAPDGWLTCNGSAVNRTTYAALYSVIGNTFGAGDGLTTFNLPDFRGRFALGAGWGPGLSARNVGEAGGFENITLSVSQMPVHSHSASQPAHTHGVYDPTHAHAIYDPAHQHSIWDPSHSHGFADPGHAHSVYEPWHYHYGYFSTNSDESSTPRPGKDSMPQWGYIGGGHDYGVSFGRATICLLTALTSYSPSGIGIYGAGTGAWNWGAYTGTVADWGGTRCGIYGAYTGISLAWAGGEAISVANAGSGQPHSNMPPFLVVNKIIKF